MRVHFGEFVLDSGERLLLRAGIEQALEPKVFDCVALLVSQAGKLTSMDQLRATLWPDVSVGEGALRRVINEARRALGDTGSDQTLIRTRKGLGYVFVGAVSDKAKAAPQVPSDKPPPWPFVGRERELETLRAWVNGDGGVCLLSGEAGAGKSSLIARLQSHGARTARPLQAQCRAAVGLPAFWPFREAAAQLMRDPALRSNVAARVRAGSSTLRLIPELAENASASRASDVPAALRFEVCEAFAGLLRDVAQATPLWLMVEDVHWADAGSVEMLEAIARQARGTQLHVFATYRPEAIVPGKTLSQWIGRTSGRDGVISVHVPALGLEDVRSLLRELRLPGFAGATAQTLRQQTGGNALFLSELVRHALSQGLPLETAKPPSLGHIVEQRVSSLPEATQRRLDQAAVLGHEFRLDVLALLAGAASPASLLAELEPALRAGVIRFAGERRDRLQFSHALVGDALVQRLTLDERTAGHATALRAFQQLLGPLAPSGVLATHAFEAGVQLASDERLRLCEQAGRDAFAQGAFDRAALHLERAVDLVDPQDGSRQAAELSLLFAKALFHADATEDEIEAAFLKAASAARRAQAPELLAEAAIGYAVGDESATRMRSVVLRPQALALAEEAWALLSAATPGGADALRGELAYRLAAALCWMRGEAGELTDFVRAARVALSLAPPNPDPFRRQWLLALARAADLERGGDNSAAETALREAEGLDPTQRIELYALTMGSCLTHADIEGYERAVSEVTRLAALLPEPWRSGQRGARIYLYRAIAALSHVTVAVMRGQLTEAERLLAQMRSQGAGFRTKPTREQTNHVFCILLQLYGYLGRASWLEPLLDRHVEAYPAVLWHVALAKTQFALERGDRELAAQHYAVLRATGFRPMLRDRPMLAKPETLVRVADACRELGTAKDAALIGAALRPRANHCIQDGALICLGSCARPLAELAVVEGRYDDAERDFQTALETNTRLRHEPERARTEFGWARMLLLAGRRDEALPHIEAAKMLATQSGMTKLAKDIEALLQNRL